MILAAFRNNTHKSQDAMLATRAMPRDNLGQSNGTPCPVTLPLQSDPADLLFRTAQCAAREDKRMAIASRLKWYLESHHINYEIIHHSHTSTALGSARAAHVPSGLVAKCVLLEDERGYVMAVIPSSCRLEIEAIDQELGRHLELATEAELGDIFTTCEVGAVPAVGDAFNIPSAVDQSLMRLPDAYFEAGDHEGLIHVSGRDFRSLLGRAREGRFSRPH